MKDIVSITREQMFRAAHSAMLTHKGSRDMLYVHFFPYPDETTRLADTQILKLLGRTHGVSNLQMSSAAMPFHHRKICRDECYSFGDQRELHLWMDEADYLVELLIERGECGAAPDPQPPTHISWRSLARALGTYTKSNDMWSLVESAEWQRSPAKRFCARDATITLFTRSRAPDPIIAAVQLERLRPTD